MTDWAHGNNEGLTSWRTVGLTDDLRDVLNASILEQRRSPGGPWAFTINILLCTVIRQMNGPDALGVSKRLSLAEIEKEFPVVSSWARKALIDLRGSKTGKPTDSTTYPNSSTLVQKGVQSCGPKARPDTDFVVVAKRALDEIPVPYTQLNNLAVAPETGVDSDPDSDADEAPAKPTSAISTSGTPVPDPEEYGLYCGDGQGYLHTLWAGFGGD